MVTKFDEMDIQYPWCATDRRAKTQIEIIISMLEFQKTFLAQKWVHVLPMGEGMHVCTHTRWHMTHTRSHMHTYARTHHTHTPITAKEATFGQ